MTKCIQIDVVVQSEEGEINSADLKIDGNVHPEGSCRGSFLEGQDYQLEFKLEGDTEGLQVVLEVTNATPHSVIADFEAGEKEIEGFITLTVEES